MSAGHGHEDHGHGGGGDGLDFLGRTLLEGPGRTGGGAISQLMSGVCSICSGLCLFGGGGGGGEHHDHGHH